MSAYVAEPSPFETDWNPWDDDTTAAAATPTRTVLRTVNDTDPVAVDGYTSAAQHVSAFADRIVAELELRAEFGDAAAGGEELGFTEVDEHMIAEGGRLIVIGAREGVGKTAWALQVARTMATRTSTVTGKGGTVVYYITEMGVQETIERVVATFAHLEARNLKWGVTLDTVAAVRRGFELLAESGLYIANAAGWDSERIDKDARAFARQHRDLRAVFVDNLTGVRPPRARTSMRSDELIGEIVGQLNTLSMMDKGLGVPVILLAHLRRPDKLAVSKRPTATDFAGSDMINRWASILVLLHEKPTEDRALVSGPVPDGPAPVGGFGGGGNPFRTKQDPFVDSFLDGDGARWSTSEVGQADTGCSHEFICVKNRGGRKFVVDLDFIGAQMRFVDPKQRTVRPYSMPTAESAARSEFRTRMRDLGDL